MLAYARQCAADGKHAAAFAAFISADRRTPLQIEDLDLLSVSAYLSGHDVEFYRVLERLHRVHEDTDNRAAAARCAFWIGFGFLLRGDLGQSNAWVRRGEEHIAGHDCVERGYLFLTTAEQQLRNGDAEAAQATAKEAEAIGNRWRDSDLAAAARHIRGRALIARGDIQPGLTLLDQTMLAVVGGELSPIMTGLMYCSVIEACREVYAIGRAHEWTSAMSRWCEQQSEMIAFNGTCLVHRAEIMQFHGAWSESLAEACRACERARRLERKPPGQALYQQAEIHRLRGEHALAEEAYRYASQLGFEPQPGLALLRLAQRRIGAAVAAIRRLLLVTTEPLRRAPLLPAHIEIMLASGCLDEARSSCEELDRVAAVCETDVLRAQARHAQGAIALAEGDAEAALGAFRLAFEIWKRLDAPYETARTRVLAGCACRALGDEDAAALEFQAARSVFEELGARPDRDALDALPPSSDRKHLLTAREHEVLMLVAAGRTNKAIAEALRLSERTIDRHVSNILTKLDVPSRAAATAYAYSHGIL
jgi:DNA-binding CsgD family transcriptional regulator